MKGKALMATVQNHLGKIAERLFLSAEDILAVVVGHDINMLKVSVYGDERVARYMQTKAVFVSHYSIDDFDIEMEDKPNVRQATRFGIHYERDEDKIEKVIIGYPK